MKCVCNSGDPHYELKRLGVNWQPDCTNTVIFALWSPYLKRQRSQVLEYVFQHLFHSMLSDRISVWWSLMSYCSGKLLPAENKITAQLFHWLTLCCAHVSHLRLEHLQLLYFLFYIKDTRCIQQIHMTLLTLLFLIHFLLWVYFSSCPPGRADTPLVLCVSTVPLRPAIAK